MSVWLRNLQGQLTDFATEVLNESTDETQDPQTECQVLKKRTVELESQLNEANGQIDQLNRRCEKADELFQATELQLSIAIERHRRNIELKDVEIRRLTEERSNNDYGRVDQKRPQHLSVSLDEESVAMPVIVSTNEAPQQQQQFSSCQEASPPLSPTAHEIELRQLRDRVKCLSAEVVHWKGVVRDSQTSENAANFEELVRLRQELSESIDQHQAEIVTLQHTHFDNIRQVRARYETQIAALQKSIEGTEMENIKDEDEQKQGTIDDWSNEKWDEEEDFGWTTEETCTDVGAKKDSVLAEMKELRRKFDQIQDENSILNQDKNRLQILVEEQNIERQNIDAVDAKWQEIEKVDEDASNLADGRNKIVELETEVLDWQKKLEQLDEQHQETMEHMQQVIQERDGRIEQMEQNLNTVQVSNQDLVKSREKLTIQNKDLATTYEELNTEYENYKAEFDLIVSSNREQKAQIETMKADLIDYEEKYQMINKEYLSTSEQLNQFKEEIALLRSSDSQESGKMAHFKEHIKTLEDKLAISEQEWTKLRESSELWEDVHNQLSSNIEHLTSTNETLVETNADLETKLKTSELVVERQTTELNEAIEEIGGLRARLDEAMTRLSDDAHIVQTKKEVSKKSSSGSEDGGDSNGWDRVVELDSQQKHQQNDPESTTQSPPSSSGATAGPTCKPTMEQDSMLQIELKETLAALTEKTEQCEELSKQMTSKDQQLNEREEVLQQAFAELKGLEGQLCEARDREANCRANIQRLTIETARKDEEIQAIRDSLEAAQSAQTDLTMQLASIVERRYSNGQTASSSPEDDEKLRENQSSGAEMDDDRLRMEIDRQKVTVEQLELELEAKITDLNGLNVEIECLNEAKVDADSKIASLYEQNHCLLEQNGQLTSQLTILNDHIKEFESETKLLREQMEKSSVEFQEASHKNSTDTVEFRQKLQNLELINRNLSEEKQQAIACLQQKHDECLLYYEEAKKLSSAMNEQRERVVAFEQESVQLRERLSACSDRMEQLRCEKDKLLVELAEKSKRIIDCEECGEMRAIRDGMQAEVDRARAEIDRLRQHLMDSEESHTKELIGAEDRETELRARLRQIEATAENASETARQSSRLHEDNVENLQVQLESMASQRDTAVMELADRHKELESTKKALASLQNVIRDMEREDGMRVSFQLDHLSAQNERLDREKTALLSEKSVMEENRLMDIAKIEKLETQVTDLTILIGQREDETRALEERLAAVPSSDAGRRGGTAVIDLEVLGSLFLSYFTAPNDKKREVAHLLASVLGFSAEEIKKMDSGPSSSWLGFIRRDRGQRSPDVSITEQFIRFLEAESLAPPPSVSKPAQPLPLQRSSPVGTSGRATGLPSFAASLSSYSRSSTATPPSPSLELLPPPPSSAATQIFETSRDSPLRPPQSEQSSSEILRDMLQQS